MKEIWLNIEGYSNYMISNYGRVKSLNYRRTGKEKILSLKKDKKGYYYITLCKNGECKTFKVHRLVAKAFIPNPNNYPQVNHKDENPSNNCVENLEWCTNEYNLNYGKCQEKRIKSRQKTYRISTVTKKKISQSLKEYYSTRSFPVR